MPKVSRKPSDAEGLDHLYNAVKRIHRIARDNAPADATVRQRVHAGLNSLLSPPRPEARQADTTRTQAAVAAVTSRFAASMVAMFGGKPMIDTLGGALRHADRKRRGGKSAE